MKRMIQSMLSIFLVVAILLSFSSYSFAITNEKGFGIYRQGNFPNPSGHAGFVRTQSVDNSQSVIHVISGDVDHLIRKTSLSVFIDEQDLYGYYVPFSLSTFSESIQRNKLNCVISKAEALQAITREYLSYNTIYQVWYSTDSDNDGIVDIDEISSMRCDGLVEYCYEYYGLSVYGGNISSFNTSIRNNHSAPNITPKQQIKNYLQNCLGDIDGNFEVTTEDSRLALRNATNSEVFDSYQSFVADVDGDGSVSVADARLIMRYATGIDSTFPADPYPNL